MSARPPVSNLNKLLELCAERETEADIGKPFLTVQDARRTARELHTTSAALATAFRKAGVGRGDRIAIMADNCIELVELWFGCAALGAILVPINTASRAAQVAHVLADSEPAVVVGTTDHLATVTDLQRPHSVGAVWSIDPPTATDWHGVPVTSVPAPAPGEASHDAPLSDPAAILYTSGTTGPSKGVVCPHSQLYWWGINTVEALGIDADDVLYNCLPLFHMNALNTIVQGLVSGARVVIGPRFSASRFWQRLTDADATATYLLGAIVSILAAQPPGELDNRHQVRVVLGPATPPELWPAFEQRFGVRLVEGHGMTETNYAIGPREGKQRPGWMGRAMPGFHARVVDDNDSQVPPNTPGELVLRAEDSAAFATGYWRQPTVTASAWEGGWFHTGDRVLRDEDGYFRFVDRLKDSIRRRGENISAWEVEQALESHPSIAAATAVPVPSDLGEDEVMAFVVLKEGAAVEPEQIIRHCESQLAYFAIPRYLEFLDRLPLTESGKVQKFVLRERGLSDATWDREREGVEIRR